MKLLIGALSWVLSAPALEDCEQCSPRKLCPAHAAAIAAALPDVKTALRSKDAEVRRQALADAAALNESHANAPSRDVTRAIAAALVDEDLAVRTAAAELLRTGQEPDAAVDALSGCSPDVGRLLSQIKSTHPDAAAAMQFSVAVVESLGSYRDDRSVRALAALLTRYPSALYGDVVYEVVDQLATLATQEGIKGLLTYYALMEALGGFARLEEHIHQKLAALAAALGEDPGPPWDPEGVSAEWEDWYKKNARHLPKKLGKATLEGG